MNTMNNTRYLRIGIAVVLFALFPLGAKASIFDAALEGQSATAPHSHTPTGTYISTNLQNWEELDTIPLRVRMSGGPVTGKTVTVTFDHQKTLGALIKPGIQNLVGFTPTA